jgi:hypothetical protein
MLIALAMARNFGRGFAAAALAGHLLADLQSYVVVERAGVRLLVGNTQLRQRLKNHVGLNFELAGQLIDSNFTHTITFRPSQIFIRAYGFSRNFGFSFSGPRCGGRDFRALYRIRFIFRRFFFRYFHRSFLRRRLRRLFFRHRRFQSGRLLGRGCF